MVLFAWVRVSKVFFGGGGVTYYNVFAFNKTEFLKGGSLAQWPPSPSSPSKSTNVNVEMHFGVILPVIEYTDVLLINKQGGQFNNKYVCSYLLLNSEN